MCTYSVDQSTKSTVSRRGTEAGRYLLLLSEARIIPLCFSTAQQSLNLQPLSSAPATWARDYIGKEVLLHADSSSGTWDAIISGPVRCVAANRIIDSTLTHIIVLHAHSHLAPNTRRSNRSSSSSRAPCRTLVAGRRVSRVRRLSQ